MTSTAATAEKSTRTAVEDVCCEVQAQIDQTRTDSQQKEEETRRQVDQIVKGLETLTEQLNSFKPASVVQVEGSQREMSTAVEERLNLQSLRIDAVDESVKRAEKTAADNSEILHNLLVGIENLSENVKQLKEEVRGYGDPEAQGELNALFQEVDETIPVAKDQVQTPTQPSSVSEPIPLTSAPILNPQASKLNTGDDDLWDMQRRFTALRSGQKESARKGVTTPFNFDTPTSMTLPYPGLDGHPRRIVPTPIFVAKSQSPAETTKSPDQPRQETAELIQRQETIKKQQEELTKKIRGRNVFTMDDPENNETEDTELPETLSISGSGVTSQPTIGSTTISSSEE